MASSSAAAFSPPPGKGLADRGPISDGQIGIGNNPVSVAAGAASIVATGGPLACAVPAVLIDRQTRETYEQHFSNTGPGTT